jgi:hypothetical protein
VETGENHIPVLSIPIFYYLSLMRLGTLLFLSFILSSCGSKETKVEDHVSAPSVKANKELVEKPGFVPKPVLDTLIVDTALKVPQESLLADSIETDYGIVRQELIRHYRFNDTMDYILFTRDDRTCLHYFIASVLADTIFEEAAIGALCDHEQSYPEYSWVEQVKDDTTGLFWLEIQRYIPDTFLTQEGEIPEGKMFDDFETVDDTIFWQYGIMASERTIFSINLNERVE